jgi:signal transduction histidine kinase
MFRRALLIFFPLAAVTSAILYVLYDHRITAVSSIRRSQETQIVRIGAQWLATVIDPIVSDVRYLSQQPALFRWMARGDAASRRYLVAAQRALIANRPDYDQVRFIDARGMEITRSDQNNGAVTVVPQSRLQNKANRYYVRETLKRAAGQIYASPFDLNVEHGAIETPIRPTIRIGVPVFDAEGRERGLVIVNYHGQALISRLRSLAIENGIELWLVNADGYWLYGPEGREWGFMYPDRKRLTLARTNPDVWKRVIASPAFGQFVADGARFTYLRVKPFADPETGTEAARAGGAIRTWFLVARVPLSAIAAQNAETVRIFLILGAIALVLLAAGAVKAGQLWTHRIEAQAHIKELNDRLTRDNIKLEAVNKELEAFNYSVSHDLRAPLRAIDGFSQALAEDCADQLTDDGRTSLDRIRNAAQRMGEIIDDLLNLSRISRADMTHADVDLSALAQAIVDDLHTSESGRQVEIEIAQDLKTQGDPRLLRLALENLIGNAWKFTSRRAPARIEFGQQEMDGEPVFYVRDNGAGFDMAHAAKIFLVFQRLHDRRDFPGTGIGLAIVQRVINRHGGRIWADSAPDQGTTIFFVL